MGIWPETAQKFLDWIRFDESLLLEALGHSDVFIPLISRMDAVFSDLLQRAGPFQAGYGRIWEDQSVFSLENTPLVPRHGLSDQRGAAGRRVAGSSPGSVGGVLEAVKIRRLRQKLKSVLFGLSFLSFDFEHFRRFRPIGPGSSLPILLHLGRRATKPLTLFC